MNIKDISSKLNKKTVKFKKVIMKKEQVVSLVRHLLSVAGGLALAYGLANSELIANISGVVLGLVALIWSVKEKTATLAQIGGVTRQLLTFVGGFLVLKGILTPEKLEATIAGIVALLPVILGQLDKISSQPEKPKP